MESHENPVTLRARGLSRSYGPRVAVQELDLEILRGEVVGLLGPNGAGKTTSMQMITGNLAPSSGSVEICGIDLLERPVEAKARVGYLPEVPPLYRELSVDEYLNFAARLHRLRGASRVRSVQIAKARCGLEEVGKRLIGSLSKGYQQRVGMAQAIVHGPDLVVLDEPTAGLDPNQIREIRALIRELRGGHSVILSTHILPEVESVCDRVEIMHEGRVVYADSIASLQRSRGASELTVGFQNPPPAEDIAHISGVIRVEVLSPHRFRISHRADIDAGAVLAEAAARHGWGLNLLAPGHATLEEVFVRITQGEDAP